MTEPIVLLSQPDAFLVAAFAACSLNEKPGSNWVEGAGGLPQYICRIARALKRSGHPTSSAVAIAVSRVKAWASGRGNVNADTRAKAAKAVAEWEKLRAKSHAKAALHKAKRGAKLAAAASSDFVSSYVLCLSDTASFNMETVRQAWEDQHRVPRDAPDADYSWVREVWTDFVIVSKAGDLYRVPYTVDPVSGAVSFGPQMLVQIVYLPVELPDDAVLEQLANQLEGASATLGKSGGLAAALQVS